MLPSVACGLAMYEQGVRRRLRSYDRLRSRWNGPVGALYGEGFRRGSRIVIINVGERQYELVEGWGELRPGWVWGQVGAVSVDSDDNVHVFTRAEHPYRVYDKSGKMIDSWGEQIFEDAHGMCITPDDTLYFVDREPQLVLKFDKGGRHRLSLGTRGVHS